MKFKNYRNKHTNDNIIHSIENVIGMPFGDVVNREPELESQYKQIGLPTNAELDSSPNAVYVHAYTRDDGTQVRAHWRGVNGGNTNPISGQIQSGINVPNFDSGIFGNLNNNTNIPNYNGGTGVSKTNNIDVQTALAPLLAPLILSQLPIQNMQAQQDQVKNNAVDNTSNFDEYNPQLYGQVETTDIEDNLFRKPIEPIKNLINNILNNKTDYNVPKTTWEYVQEKIYTDLLKSKFPMASEATENGMNDLSAAKRNPNARVYESINDLEDKSLVEKLKNLDADDKIKGIVYDSNSKEAKKISNSRELNNYINEMINNGGIVQNEDIEFRRNNNIFSKDNDLYYSLQNVTVHSPKISENGKTFTCKIIDVSDFKKRQATLFNIPNNWGYNMQEKGKYKNYFEVIEIEVPLTNEQVALLKRKKR